MSDEIHLHPVQTPRRAVRSVVPRGVALAAYEVYCDVYRPQEALISGTCRGGFSAGELVALLYARSFPRGEWRTRVNEAFEGMAGMSP